MVKKFYITRLYQCKTSPCKDISRCWLVIVHRTFSSSNITAIAITQAHRGTSGTVKFPRRSKRIRPFRNLTKKRRISNRPRSLKIKSHTHEHNVEVKLVSKELELKPSKELEELVESLNKLKIQLELPKPSLSQTIELQPSDDLKMLILSLKPIPNSSTATPRDTPKPIFIYATEFENGYLELKSPVPTTPPTVNEKKEVEPDVNMNDDRMEGEQFGTNFILSSFTPLFVSMLYQPKPAQLGDAQTNPQDRIKKAKNDVPSNPNQPAYDEIANTFVKPLAGILANAKNTSKEIDNQKRQIEKSLSDQKELVAELKEQRDEWKTLLKDYGSQTKKLDANIQAVVDEKLKSKPNPGYEFARMLFLVSAIFAFGVFGALVLIWRLLKADKLKRRNRLHPVWYQY